MDLTLTEDQATIQKTARELLDARSTDGMDADPAGYPASVWTEVVELGWPGLAIPEAYGGVGAGFVELCLLVEELGRCQTPLPLLPTAACCAPTIQRHGTDTQRSEWLGAIAEGRVMTYALANPGGGWSDAGDGVGVRRSNGSFILDGTAWFVPYAGSAMQLLVVAHRSDADAGPIVLVVDAGAGGVSSQRLDAVGPDPLYRVDLDDVVVPAQRVLGDVEDASDVVDTLTSHGAAATTAAMVGGAQRVLDLTVEYAGEREQFGRPIGSFQAVQHHCADMAIDVLTSRYIAYEAIWRLAEGLDAATEVAMAKAAVGEAYERVAALGHQVHGAIGFTKEHQMHHYLRHAMAASVSFGDSEFHWDRVADRLRVPSGHYAP